MDPFPLTWLGGGEGGARIRSGINDRWSVPSRGGFFCALHRQISPNDISVQFPRRRWGAQGVRLDYRRSWNHVYWISSLR